MKSRLESKVGVLNTATVIQNWAELETVSPASRTENPLLKELELEQKTVFLYAGNMGYPNDIETFIAVAEELDQTEPDVHFVFLGAGVKKPLLDNAVKALTLKNITILESRPREEQQTFLNACDVGIVSLVNKMRGVSMPSRTYNILAAGKPILALCDPESEVALVVKEEKAGWIVEPGDHAGLKRTIINIRNQKDQLASYGLNARRAAVSKYSLQVAISKYEKALKPGGTP
jgi:glycosyltransferase involved in cell wall biosynthesis